MKIVDTNVLLYAVHDESPHHGRCRHWIETALAGNEALVFDWLVVAAFLRVATNQKVYRKPLTVEQALAHMENWLAAPTTIFITPKSDHWTILADLLRKVGTSGSLTTDAHLAALAISHDTTLVSCDADFARFPGLKWENPLISP